MKLTATTSQTITTQVELSPKLLATVHAKALAIQRAQADMAALKDKIADYKSDIEAAFIEAGEANALMDGVEVNGIPVKMVCGTTSKLNKKRLVELGCSPAWLEEATEVVPKKAYVKVGKGGDD